MSPIFQNLKVNLGLKEKEKYAWPSMFALLFSMVVSAIVADFSASAFLRRYPV